MSVEHFSQFGLSLKLRAEAEQLRQALQARPTVDVAKGMLMALYGYDEQDAFAELRRVSPAHRVGMAELAVALVAQVCGPDRDRNSSGEHTHPDFAVRAVRTDVGAVAEWPAILPGALSRLAPSRCGADLH